VVTPLTHAEHPFILSDTICAAAILEAVPDFAVQSIKTLQPGWDSVVFLVNERWIFRIPTRPEVVDGLRREIALLPIIASRTATPIPHFEIVAESNRHTPFPFVGYRRLPGEPLGSIQDRLNPAAISSVATQIGRFLTDLHTTPLEHGIHAGLEPFNVEDWVSEHAELIDEVSDIIADRLGRSARDRITRYIHELSQRIDWHAVPPALIHSDLGTEHILVDLEDGHRVSVIDFGDLRIGDPAMDLAGLPDAFVPGTVASYGAEFGSDYLDRRAYYRAHSPAHALRAGRVLARPDLIEEGLERYWGMLAADG
jgi:aminoglycoside phosphotransferase (APT) family kinase protein